MTLRTCAAALLLALIAVAPAAADALRDPVPRFGNRPPHAHQVYIFGIHPLHNPKKLFESYNPLLVFLGRHIAPARLVFEGARSFEDFEKKLYGGYYHFALPNPQETVHAVRRGYRIFGKVGRDEPMHGLIVVRKDSGIRKVKDLKGKRVVFPSATAFAAGMAPQYFLAVNGIDVNRDIDVGYVGTQESSIRSVLSGQAAAGATWTMPWRSFRREYPKESAELTALWRTEPIPPSGLVVRRDVPADVAGAVARAAFAAHRDPEGRAALARIPVPRLEPADEATYRQVRSFLVEFNRRVRPLPEPAP